MKAPNGRLSGNGLPRSADMVGHSGAPKTFLCHPNFVVLRKIFFKLMINNKIFPPKKCILPPNP